MTFNKLRAYTTDTAYRIRSTSESAGRLVACFLNPLTALSAELEGRHYGGGVLELVPSEIERLAIVLPSKASIDVQALDKAVRRQPAKEVLATHGGKVLSGIGLSRARQDDLMHAWTLLRNRRHRTPTPAADAR